ncbi:TAXI family TRAP transporter solute-binding subunit, partial [Klebsiella quasipneumoniae]
KSVSWHHYHKLPNGKPVYELKKAVTESGWLSDSKVKVPCTKTLVIANTDAGDDMLETASTVLLKNLSRVLGTNGK